MWYSGKNITSHIGYATSDDGEYWTKYDDSSTTSALFAESDPVLNPGQPGEWDDEQASAPYVLLLDTTYHMWYRGKEIPGGNSPASIGHATSTNGINWEKDTLNNPVLSPGLPGSWDAQWIGYQSVLFDGTIYHMWYEGWGGGVDQTQIGHATSSHPDSVWTKDTLNIPVLSFSLGRWDYPRVDFPNVIYDGQTYHMLYSGGDYYTWQIGYATSDDGINWEKDTLNNPVLSPGSAVSWDNIWVGFCSVILEDSTLMMWYSGGNAVGGGHIGYATAVSALEQIDSGHYPEGYVLNQNYPNPFNPSTTIEFSIPKSEFVTLKIYNLLGQELATLVSDNLIAGNYKYSWESGELASSIYLYKLQTKQFTKTQKMILLR
jgi:predicted GH43/DUF377 family glycosyl hydrolase